MNDHPSSLDIDRLEFVRKVGAKIIAQCPACAADGHDTKGEHLAVYPDGGFACVVNLGQSEESKKHRSKIRALVGKKTRAKRDPLADRERREKQAAARLIEQQRERLLASARGFLSEITERYPWSFAEIMSDSPTKKAGNASVTDSRIFLSALFAPSDRIWTGKFDDTGRPWNASHWKTLSDWCLQPANSLGPMVSPAVWPAGTISRSGINVLAAPYVVLDFDTLKGEKPKTPAEKRRLQLVAFSVIRWLREERGWHLAAIIATGGKGIQAWFHHPPQEALESLEGVASAFGIDSGLLGHPEHPCRLPGQLHADTGVPSVTLWLQAPNHLPNP
ncbi:MAG: hypothetical protein RLZZ505_2760 [Verrucomicrobiota bacterium]|jgi:hypothetical protein